MEALTLTRQTQQEALDFINQNLNGESYVNQFSVTFPGGVNTASVMEICRVLNAPTFENKVALMKLCILGKNVEVKCPNGDVEKFCMTSVDDNLEAFPLFAKDPLALMAIADALYGYVLKKYVRLSRPKEADAKTTSKE